MRVACSAAAMAMLAALFVGGAQPAAVGMFGAPWDKLAHVGFFLALTLLLCELLPKPAWLPFGLALAIGLADEWHQLYLPGRHFGWDDVAADAVGVLLALVLVRGLRKR